MATLIIGNGSHGQDIGATCFGAEYVAHHTNRPLHPYDFYDDIFIGTMYPQTRAKIASELGIKDSRWVHPNALIERTSLGYGTHVNYAASMTRTRIGNHCSIAPGVIISGDVIIGDRCLIGAGANICDRVTIGDDVTIGAGAVVLPETVIPDGETWVGIPAKMVR